MEPIDFDGARRLFRELADPQLSSRDADLPDIDGYVLDRRLGSGGAADVYLGYRAGSMLPVAIKVLRAPIDDDRAAARVQREIELLADLRLEAVPRVLDDGFCDGRVYVVTEFIDGRPLTGHADDGGLDRRARVELLARACEAVQTLHDHGVIHRDLKPANIMVDHYGRPIIIDLGIARVVDEARRTATVTTPGELLGSPWFVSPEQARGDHHALTTRSDVYGLGVCGYELLLGAHPHEACESVTELVRQIGHAPARDPGAIALGFPRALAAVLAKAVAFEPESRYASAHALAEDLRRWLRGDAVSAAPPSRWQRVIDAACRHPVLLMTLLCGTIAALTLGATLLSLWWLTRLPYHVETAPDGSYAELTSRGGLVLHTWRAGVKDGIAFAARVRSDPVVDDFVLIGFNQNAETEHRGKLCAFPLRGDRDVPLREDRVREGEVPAALAAAGSPEAGNYSVHWALVEDFLPEQPGREILVTYQHGPESGCIMRLLDLRFARRWEGAHDGALATGQWSHERRMLMLVGQNAASWQKRGVAVPSNPLVVLGVRPRAGMHIETLLSDDDRGGIEQLLWYRALQPPEVAQRLGIGALARPRASEPGAVRLGLTVIGQDDKPLRPELSVPITWDGELLREGIEPNDAYEALPLQQRADVTALRLGPLRREVSAAWVPTKAPGTLPSMPSSLIGCLGRAWG